MTAGPAQTSAPRRRLVLGTSNRKKAVELVDLLGPLAIDVVTLADLQGAIDIDETGSSFAENAALKATRQARHLRAWVLGDDSGLTVEALGGAPGVYSARYAGPAASDADNRAKLLAELADVAPERRQGAFECHLALADPAGAVRATAVGRCRGRIRLQPAGCGGFGYDPLFEVVEYHRTFGELSPAIKSVLSHRARASEAMLPQIEGLIAGGAWEAQ